MARILSLALNPTVDVSAETDVVHKTHKTRTTNEVFEPGGGGVNVARVIDELGGLATVFCLAGGLTGDLLVELLQLADLDAEVVHIAGQTRMAHMVYERSTGAEYRFIPSGPHLSDEEIGSALAMVEATPFGWLVASGSIPEGTPASILAEFGNVAARKGAKFVLDSHGPGLKATLGHTPIALVKPSLNELGAYIGNPLDVDAAARAAHEIVTRGDAEIMVVSLGADGALLATGTSVLRIEGLPVTVKSAVGAGDSFVAGMTLALSQGKSTEEAALFGAAAGTAAVLTPGTELCSRQQVRELYEQMKRLMIKPVAV